MDKRLTDTDAWFLTTDCPDGLKYIERKAPVTKIEGDFETGNMRYKVAAARSRAGRTGAARSPRRAADPPPHHVAR
jgi:hypothetical protein